MIALFPQVAVLAPTDSAAYPTTIWLAPLGSTVRTASSAQATVAAGVKGSAVMVLVAAAVVVVTRYTVESPATVKVLPLKTLPVSTTSSRSIVVSPMLTAALLTRALKAPVVPVKLLTFTPLVVEPRKTDVEAEYSEFDVVPPDWY